MPNIQITTFINAPLERCFDLSRSIDLHKISTQHTNEEAIDGVTSGLIDLGEHVTWRARHFFVTQKLTTKITEYESPFFFVDEMEKGAFESFRHEHFFKSSNGITEMTDHFLYKSPFGILGSLADFIFLKRYMKNLLLGRNKVIKDFAESDRWKELLE
ncbi:cell division protein [Marivirga lumbricoides]|uniref:Cell division protein n=1 Tax=Marivirga lumbricoides TaxID=1046115 RepID=A0A2T4DVY2_9BACT|nr:cell division protein [Marivirga lumbricoides]